MLKSRRMKLLSLLVGALLTSTSGLAYAAYCGLDEYSYSYYPPAPRVTSSAPAGATITVAATGLSRAMPYLVYLGGACVAYNQVFLGPHDEIAPDASGNIAPFEVDLPGDTSIGAGDCSIHLASVDGAEATEYASVTVTSAGTPCAPDPTEGGLFEDLPANGCERHHMPSQAGAKELLQKLNVSKEDLKKCLPAIRLTRAEHQKTGSWGYSTGASDRSKNSVAYRDTERQQIRDAGDLITNAFETGAADIRGKVPGKEAALEAARQALARFDDCIRKYGGTPIGDTTS